MTPHLQQKGDKKMNKEKALKIIQDLKEQINKNEMKEARLYIQSWVIGGLNQIESKINGGSVYPYNATYEYLFKEFINYFFCRNIDPAIKVYAIASLFTFEVRDMIIRLFETIFDLKYRNTACKSTGFIEWNNKWMNDQTRFEIIRRWSESERSHD